MTNASPQSPTILVVDDVPENVQIAAHILDTAGYEVAVALDGETALSLATEAQPDLILLDVTMPKLDGFEVCERLKRMPDVATVPVIFLTARTDTEDIVRGFDVGGVDYVTKPFHPAELLARVRTHIQLHQLQSLLSLCSYCNRINDGGKWRRFESYIREKTGTQFSHSICPDCYKRHFPEEG